MLTPAAVAAPFEHGFRVVTEDIDENGHVNNLIYLRWVQEIATLHWQTLAPAAELETLLWVISRHEIDYKSAALLHDEVLAKTWVGGLSGLTFERHTSMQRRSDGQILAIARTLWIPINRQTRRPQRLRPELRALFSVPAAKGASKQAS